MKRFALLVTAFLALVGTARAGGSFQPVTISMTAGAGGFYTSTTGINVEQASGDFSICGRVSGAGTAKLEYMTSNDDVTYRVPQNDTDIISNFTGLSGPGSDGYFCASFGPDYCHYLKLKLSETASSNPVTLTGTLLIEKR